MSEPKDEPVQCPECAEMVPTRRLHYSYGKDGNRLLVLCGHDAAPGAEPQFPPFCDASFCPVESLDVFIQSPKAR